MADEVRDVLEGEGWALANVDALGEGPGFRKVRRELGVTAFGVNAIEIPPGYETGKHFHDEQEEPALYVVAGGKDGYVGRDGRLPDDETSRFGQSGTDS